MSANDYLRDQALILFACKVYELEGERENFTPGLTPYEIAHKAYDLASALIEVLEERYRAEAKTATPGPTPAAGGHDSEGRAGCSRRSGGDGAGDVGRREGDSCEA